MGLTVSRFEPISGPLTTASVKAACRGATLVVKLFLTGRPGVGKSTVAAAAAGGGAAAAAHFRSASSVLAVTTSLTAGVVVFANNTAWLLLDPPGLLDASSPANATAARGAVAEAVAVCPEAPFAPVTVISPTNGRFEEVDTRIAASVQAWLPNITLANLLVIVNRVPGRELKKPDAQVTHRAALEAGIRAAGGSGCPGKLVLVADEHDASGIPAAIQQGAVGWLWQAVAGAVVVEATATGFVVKGTPAELAAAREAERLRVENAKRAADAERQRQAAAQAEMRANIASVSHFSPGPSISIGYSWNPSSGGSWHVGGGGFGGGRFGGGGFGGW